MKLFFALFLFLMCSCSNSEWTSVPQPSSPVGSSEDSLSGMIRVDAKGVKIALGTDSEKARANERPQMQVKFDYTFSLAKHETVCGEFNGLMGRATGLVLDCSNDSLPATNVTYYDAVLFANERSKAEGFDTAYTYVNATFDNEKHCTNLEGFAYHPETNSYRLPTDAEWVLAARLNWNPQYGWIAENSGDRLHKVCGRMDPEAKFCDMAGNAMEWVNDWLGNFRDTILENYVGAPDGGSLGLRIVKGGGYHNTLESVNVYSRGDVYTVASSSRADYVGFRLAFGKIPNAVWMDANGKANASRIIPLTNSTTMRSLVGTYRTKLAFRNDLSGNLAFIDYSTGILSVVEIVDTLEVYHPEISPDGKKVAFCTGLEGVSGKSSLYVRNLDAEGSNLVKLKVESAAIPRWRVLENGDTVIVYVTDAGNNKDAVAFKSASTWQVPFSKGKFGTPKKLFDGAYHGGISEDNTLAVSGARLLRARVAAEGMTLMEKALDTVWYKNGENAEQACNVSLARDSSKRTLFLDFGGKTGQEFVGSHYGVHERLLIADASGRLVQSVGAPSGNSFDHSEWVLSGTDNAVATLVNANGSHSKIVLVHLSDSSLWEIAAGEELWHPCLWVDQSGNAGESSLLDVDSAGVYYVDGGSDRSAILRYRMEMYWKYKDSTEVVGLGSSRMSNGFNPSLLNSHLGLNLSYFPNTIHDVLHFADRYVYGRFDTLKYLLVSVDIDFWNSPIESSFFTEEYLYYPGYVYDEHHHYGADYPDELIYEATSLSMGVDRYRAMFLNNYSSQFAETGGWGGKSPTVEKDSCWMDYSHEAYARSLETFKSIIERASKENVTVIGIVFPQAPGYRNTGAFGRHGLRRSEAVKVLDTLKQLQKVYRNFIFMDENKMGNHDYDDDMAQDCDHLSMAGASHFMVRLDSLLNTLK